MIQRELGKRLGTGGEPELEEVIDAFGEKLLRYATSILCDNQDAEDIIQNVFLAAYQKRAGFDGVNLSAWLYKITYNQCVNHLKKGKLLFFSDFRNIREEIVNPYEETGFSEDFLKALKRLGAEDRALLYGRIMDDQSYEELSGLFGKSPPALRKQYERAKKKLAGHLSAGKNFFERSEYNEYKFEQAR